MYIFKFYDLFIIPWVFLFIATYFCLHLCHAYNLLYSSKNVSVSFHSLHCHLPPSPAPTSYPDSSGLLLHSGRLLPRSWNPWLTLPMSCAYSLRFSGWRGCHMWMCASVYMCVCICVCMCVCVYICMHLCMCLCVCVHLCVCVCVFLCMYMYVWLHFICTCVCGGQRLTFIKYLRNRSPPYFLKPGISLTQFTHSVRVSGQQGLWILLSHPHLLALGLMVRCLHVQPFAWVLENRFWTWCLHSKHYPLSPACNFLMIKNWNSEGFGTGCGS